MDAQEIVIKKYPNRRLYDTSSSAYITLEDVKRLVVAKRAVRVVDAKTDEDLTRQTFMQIMLEEESGGSPVFSADMLAQMISFYGQAQHSALGPFLDASLKAYVRGAEAMAKQAAALKGGARGGADSAIAAGASAWAEVAKAQQAAMASMLETMGKAAGSWMPKAAKPKATKDKDPQS